jgi:penicillin-binding protein 1C
MRDLHWLTSAHSSQPSHPLLLAEAAFVVKDMLAANPRPDRSFGGHSFSAQQSVAWKTGTSSGLKDAWAIGISGDYLIGVWAGNFDGSANRHLIGRELMGPLLFDLFDALAVEHRGSTRDDKPPTKLQRIEICALSGRPISPWCPHAKSGWIIPGVSPLKTCTIHRQIHINPATGLRMCAGDNGPSLQRIAEFWDSDELESFKQAGVQRDNPPPFQHPCDDASEHNAEANPPKIVSPQAGVSYPLRLGQQATIEFSAVSGGGRHRLFWFLDDNFIGEGATVNWLGKPGRFIISVVDEQGQSASTTLLVTPVES